MSIKPKLSILLITFNQESYIQQCLDGILIQKIPFEFEIIIADDCSEDKTLTIIEQTFKQKDLPYTILDSDKNIGMAKNYKRGFSACSGTYVATLEGDDYWTDPERLIKHVDFLDRHHECVLSFNRFVKFNEKTCRFYVEDWEHLENFEYITTHQMALSNRIGNLSACVFRLNDIKKLGTNFFEQEVADWGLGMALGQFGLMAKMKEVMSVYRIHSKGQWSKLSESEKTHNLMEMIEKWDRYLNYNFTKEFTTHKNRLIKPSTDRQQKLNVFSYFYNLLKFFIPKKIKVFIKNHLCK
jgi:glycosyltransferase involved in cell wall biosynthesis